MENHPNYIKEALRRFHVEIDVWYVDGQFFLGHDEPLHNIQESFLENDRLWCHAKNMKAMDKMLGNVNIHCFWHDKDDCTLTSRNFIWNYPGIDLTARSICLMPENSKQLPIGCAGVCTDYANQYEQDQV
jgi:hypothetical protein